MDALTFGSSIGPYQILRLLGRGGMGEVYLAENRHTGWRRALKILPEELSHKVDFIERFKREASVLDRLNHPHIVRVREMGEDQGRFYLVMDYVEGPEGAPLTLGDRATKSGGRIPPLELGKILIEVCEALAYAHGEGVIHRDLKPTNILLNRNGRAIVSDFGLARVVGREFLQSRIEESISRSLSVGQGVTILPSPLIDPSIGEQKTNDPLGSSSRSILGTWDYMAPEVKNGEEATERSDIYAVGVILYRLLTGVKQIGVEAPSELVDGVSVGWNRVYRLAVATRPERRIADCHRLKEALQEALNSVESRSTGASVQVNAAEEDRKIEQCRDALRLAMAQGTISEGARSLLFELRRRLGIPTQVADAVSREVWSEMRASATPTSGPKPPLELPAGHPPLHPFEFTVVTVDEFGNSKEKKKGTNWKYTEDLRAGVGLDMVYIPGGTFVMGAPPSEEESGDSEHPQHQVTIRPFFMGMFPVTQAQLRAVSSLPPVSIALPPDPSHFKGGSRPVESVSWRDGQELIARLSRRTGRKYCLPSEAQWEYACRAGTTTPFHFGPTITTSLVNYDGNYPYGNAPRGRYREQTTPVGSFQWANAFGLYDMHGNVWEWCEDPWRANYEGASNNDGGSWVFGGGEGRRVIRGGYWDCNARHCRSASRYGHKLYGRHSYLGVRVARTP